MLRNSHSQSTGTVNKQSSDDDSEESNDDFFDLVWLSNRLYFRR